MTERFTRPPAGTEEMYADWNGEYEHRYGNSNRNNASVTFSDKGKNLLAITLALSWVLMALLYYQMREVAQEQRLKQYNLDWFRGHEFAELEGKVAVQGRLIDFLQTKTACTKL